MLANQNVVQILSTLLTQRGNCRENGERGRVVDVSDQEVSPTLPEDGLIANPVDFFDALVDRRNLARTALLSLGVVPEKSEKDTNNVARWRRRRSLDFRRTCSLKWSKRG